MRLVDNFQPKLYWLLPLLLLSVPVLAQTDNPPISTQFSNPAGLACSAGTGAIYAVTGTLFTCQGGVFVAVTAGGSVPSFPLSPTNGGVGGAINVPLHLRFLGDGSDGAINCSGNLSGVKYATTFNVSVGNTCTANSTGVPLTIYATGACTIAGTLNARGVDGGSSLLGDGGGSGGGGGGGTGAGLAGIISYIAAYTATNAYQASGAGVAGTAGGNVGGNATVPSANAQRILWNTPRPGFYGGAAGGRGGSSGGLGGNGGQAVVMTCASINFTGTIAVDGAAGANSSGNNLGSGGGGGGGYVWLIGRDSVTNSGTITVTGGAGGTCGAFTGCGAGGTGANGWSKTAVMQ